MYAHTLVIASEDIRALRSAVTARDLGRRGEVHKGEVPGAAVSRSMSSPSGQAAQQRWRGQVARGQAARRRSGGVEDRLRGDRLRGCAAAVSRTGWAAGGCAAAVSRTGWAAAWSRSAGVVSERSALTQQNVHCLQALASGVRLRRGLFLLILLQLPFLV